MGEIRKEDGIDTTYFSEEEVALIESFADTKPVVTPAVVDVGNHAMVLANPKLEKSLSLGRLRSVEAQYFEDPLALAAMVIDNVETVIEAMDDDIKARQNRLKQTVKAQEQIQEKVDELKLKQRIYRERTLVVDTQLNLQTDALRDALGVLNDLKKTEE
jgi:hypothetical protein